MRRDLRGRIPVTAEMRKELQGWQDKTGFGITALFRHAEINDLFKATKTLSAPAFQAVLKGRTLTVRQVEFNAVLNAYKSIPMEHYGKPHALSRQKERVPLSDDMKAKLQSVLDSTSLTRAALLRLHGAPEGLTTVKLGRILRRYHTTVERAHAEFFERLIQARVEDSDKA